MDGGKMLDIIIKNLPDMRHIDVHHNTLHFLLLDTVVLRDI